MNARMLTLAVLTAGMTIAFSAPGMAASCFDLWYARNSIFNDNGYCFSSSLGKRTFDNSDCYTRNPRLSASEQRQVNRILAEERRRGCKVNK